jgi:hypothetical protein
MVWKTLIDASCYIIDASKSHAFVRCIARAALNFYFIFKKKKLFDESNSFLDTMNNKNERKLRITKIPWIMVRTYYNIFFLPAYPRYIVSVLYRIQPNHN